MPTSLVSGQNRPTVESVRLEPDPVDGEVIVLVDDDAPNRASHLVTADVVAVAVLTALATAAVSLGPAGVFSAILGFLLLSFALARQQLPSSRPLVLDDHGATIRIVGAGLRVHWDAVEAIDARVSFGPRWRWTARPAPVAVTFRLRPGAGAQGLVTPLGWRSGWLLWQDKAAVRHVPPDVAEHILSIAGALHRKRLAETSRLGPELPGVPRYPG